MGPEGSWKDLEANASFGLRLPLCYNQHCCTDEEIGSNEKPRDQSMEWNCSSRRYSSTIGPLLKESATGLLIK